MTTEATNLDELVDRHTRRALIEAREAGGEPQRYAVLVHGTKRCAYLGVVGELTNDERAARVLDKAGATELMGRWYDKDRGLWRQMRLIPLRAHGMVAGGQLPTVNGY